jgi:Fe2+ or Zn2+ uptake regulation protein
MPGRTRATPAKGEAQLEILKQKVKSRGYRLTRQRQIVLEELAKTDFHPRADELYALVRRRLPAISFATVYRTLGTLEELGLSRSVRFGSKSARFDANVGSHQHFVCERCDRIVDIDFDLGIDLEVPGLQRQGYEVRSARVQLLGLCPDCRRKSAR